MMMISIIIRRHSYKHSAIPSVVIDVVIIVTIVIACLYVRLSHPCSLLKPMDGMKCHLTETLE